MAKQRLTAYVPEGVFDEIMAAAKAAERSPGWVVTQAWNRAPITPAGPIPEPAFSPAADAQLAVDGSTVVPAPDRVVAHKFKQGGSGLWACAACGQPKTNATTSCPGNEAF